MRFFITNLIITMIYIGISGWSYPNWRGVFYPKDLPQKKELEYASSVFPSVEINATHYGLQRPSSFLSWYERTPNSFVFSVKAHRYITHVKKLHEVEVPLANFFASGVLALKEKLGPILWQFPPSFKYDATRMREFFSLLPTTTKQALSLAEKNNLFQDKVWLNSQEDRPLQHCLEIRNPSFMVPEFFHLLKENKVTFVFADTANKWPYSEDLTSDFLYLRLHGAKELYLSGYTSETLHYWAHRIQTWSKGRQVNDAITVANNDLITDKTKDVYVYFDNSIKIKAPEDAKQLISILAEEKTTII